MKAVLSLLVQLFTASICFAQHVGIGITEPLNKLHVSGNLLVNETFIKNQAAPTVAQTQNMVNGGTIQFLNTDSTGYIYDPGGPAGDYSANTTAYANLYINGAIGFELNFEDIQLGIGDSVIIRESPFSTNPPWYAVGNGFNTPEKITIPSSFFYLVFKSNNDATNGSGFRLLFRTLFNDTAQEDIKGFMGQALFYEPKTGSLRFGITDNSVRGIGSFGGGLLSKASGFYSAAFGNSPTASGNYAVALGTASLAQGMAAFATGQFTQALGDYSTAMGYSTTASGYATTAIGAETEALEYGATAMGIGSTASAQAATAMGDNTMASGPNATALGSASIASGANSFVGGTSSLASGVNAVAIGTQVAATGSNSTALGNYVSTAGFNGAFIIGDNSTTSSLSASGPNTFRARFVGGYALFTGLGPSIGVVLNPAGNSWSAISDVRLKENFLSVNGEEILTRIAKLPLSTWNYIGQDLRTFRHYGPMAQDFYEAFGHDEFGKIGCDTLINQQDFLGVNLIGIQALEKRTAEQKEQIRQLSAQMELLKEQNDKLISLIKELTANQKLNANSLIKN